MERMITFDSISSALHTHKKIQDVSRLCQIQDIVRMTHLLSVFRTSEDNHGDVDMAILQALLKGSPSIFHYIMSDWTSCERLKPLRQKHLGSDKLLAWQRVSWRC